MTNGSLQKTKDEWPIKTGENVQHPWQGHENEDFIDIPSPPIEKIISKKLTTAKACEEKESFIHCQGESK